jgi:hypothetical protein
MIYMAIIEINIKWEIEIKSSILIKAAIYYSSNTTQRTTQRKP